MTRESTRSLWWPDANLMCWGWPMFYQWCHTWRAPAEPPKSVTYRFPAMTTGDWPTSTWHDLPKVQSSDVWCVSTVPSTILRITGRRRDCQTTRNESHEHDGHDESHEYGAFSFKQAQRWYVCIVAAAPRKCLLVVTHSSRILYA